MKRPLFLLCFAFFIAVFLLITIIPLPSYQDVFQTGQQIMVIGKVVKIESKKDKNVIYLNKIQYSGSSSNQKSTNKISTQKNKFNQKNPQGVLCYMDDFNVPKIGSIVKIEGNYMAFESATNEGQFDLKKYYQIEKIDFAIMKAVCIAESKHFNAFRQTLYEVKLLFCNVYDDGLSVRHAGVMKAMLVNEKSDLEDDLKGLFQRTGIAHILSISGLHISIIGMALFQLLQRFRCKIHLCVMMSSFFMISYGMMVDGGTSTVRAIVMFLLYLFAKVVKRSYDMLTAMAISGVLLLVEQPLYIVHTGFLLSYSAVMGIALAAPIFEELFPKNKIGKAFAFSMGIFFFNLPLQMLFFYEIPVYSVLLNLIIIPPVTFIMILGMLCGIIGLFVPVISSLLLKPCGLLLYFYEVLCKITERLPFHKWITGTPSITALFLFYGGIVLLLFSQKRIKQWLKETQYIKEKYRKVLSSGYLFFLFLILVFSGKKENKIAMLDIGQGDCNVVSTKNGTCVLIDAGSSSEKEAGKYRLIPYLKKNGIYKISYAFISHPDSDHYSVLVELLQTMKESGIFIDYVVLSKSAKGNQAYTEIIEAAKNAKVPVVYINEGMKVSCSPFRIRCLYDGTQIQDMDDNNASMVLEVTYLNTKCLFTGDLGIEGEKVLLPKLVDEYRILKVAHHGSKNSSSQEFLDRISPEIALISCGKENRYGHPHKETCDRLLNVECKIYKTSFDGELSMIFERDRILVRTFQKMAD